MPNSFAIHRLFRRLAEHRSETVVLDLMKEQGPSKVITVGSNGSNPANVFPQAIRGGKGNHCLTRVPINHQCLSMAITFCPWAAS